MGAVEETVAVGWALGAYRSRILPAARRLLRHWDGRAAEMPDGSCRDAATAALRLKRRNPEATAVFALLAPRGRRAAVLRAVVALEVAVDYLDELTERPGTTLEASLRLHRALLAAVAPEAGGVVDPDWEPPLADGGYLRSLVLACRRELASLPAADAVGEEMRRSATRCGEGQSHTHVGGAQLRAWAQTLNAPPGYRWWEVAAGASSSVAVHALLAAAADPATRPDEAGPLAAAYFPPIGALTVLLDDLVDREADLASGQPSYLSHYPDPGVAADRLGFLAERARDAVAPLRHRRLHGAILAGVAGFYLSAPEARRGPAEPARAALRAKLGPALLPVLLALRLTGRDRA